MKVKKTVDVPLDFSKVKVMRNVRSDVARRVEEDWVKNGPKRFLGNQFFTLGEDGKVTPHDWISRQDVLQLTLWDGFHALVEPDRTFSVEPFDKTEISDEEMRKIKAWIEVLIHDIELEGYINHERTFLETQPWMKCGGMTPEQAVAYLKGLGWY